jgi:hypothetical protein
MEDHRFDDIDPLGAEPQVYVIEMTQIVFQLTWAASLELEVSMLQSALISSELSILTNEVADSLRIQERSEKR